MFDKGIEMARTDIIMAFHSDMVACKDFDINILKHLEKGKVITGTRVEPPLHPDGPEKILRNFGIEVDEFNMEEWYEKSNLLKNVLVCYENEVAIAIGAYKEYDSETVEIKRMFTLPEHRAKGIASKILALKIPGISTEKDYRRTYPDQEISAHVVGFSGNDGNGLEGVEYKKNDFLSGTHGYKKILKTIEKINKDHEKFQYNNRADGPSNIFKGLQQVERTCYDLIREIEQGKWDGKVDLEE